MSFVLYSVSFSGTSKTISSASKVSIKKALERLSGTPTIMLEAYSETDSPDQIAKRMAITAARATSVRDYMISLGYPAHKVLLRVRADRKFENFGPDRHAASSRRVELLVLS
jgi:hypothetical protein